MLPKTRLGRKKLSKPAPTPEPEHPHAAQQPEAFTIASRRTSTA